jgi:hypothetical protein
MKLSERKPVSGFFTGIVFTLVGLLCFVTIYHPYIARQVTIYLIIINIGVILFISFIIGCFMPSLRDSGFRYYMLVRGKRLEKIKEAKKDGKELKYPGRWQNFIYKTFRDGSVAEECSESWRNFKKGEPSYRFLEDCKNVQEAVDKHRNLSVEIALNYPKLGIKKTYHDSEKFQCLDTGFLFFSILALILEPVNLYLNYFGNNDFSLALPLVFGGLFFAVHKLCKQKSKDMAHRYLIDINSGWKEIMAKESSKEKEAVMKQDNVIFSPVISPIIQVGNGNKGDITIYNGINEAYVEYKLKEAGVSEDQIKSISSEIGEIVIECNKKKPDEGKLYSLFTKVKEIGGNILFDAFKFLTQTAIGGIIQKLFDKVL